MNQPLSTATALTIILPTWRIWWVPNASKWQRRFNSAFKGLTSSGSKKKEPRYTCLSEAKTSHSQRMWTEVSSSAPHLLYNGLSDSPVRWRCLLKVLCPVRRPVTALDCFLLKGRNLVLAPRQGPEINSRAYLPVLSRPEWSGLVEEEMVGLGQTVGFDSRHLAFAPKMVHTVTSYSHGQLPSVL
jgi:hypothetical protein